MRVDVEVFEPHTASETTLRAYHEMWARAWAVDFAEDPPVAYEAAVDRLLNQPDGDVESTYWIARDGDGDGDGDGAGDGDGDGDGIAGIARFALGATTPEIARIEIRVDPRCRRQGVGAALLCALLPALRESGRTVVIGTAMKRDCPAYLWARKLGFRTTHTTLLQVLDAPAAGDGRWRTDLPDGYRFERWLGSVPDDLLGGYVLTRNAISEAPMGDSSNQMPQWTAESVRETEEELRAMGAQERVVCAVETATGAVAGLTGMIFYAHQPDVGRQNDTVVAPGHRGRGLGLAVKSAMMEWVLAERPVAEVRTIIAESNGFMRAVNEAMGYRVLRTMVWIEMPAERLLEAVAGRQDLRT